MNGTTIYAGRAAATLFAGRAMPAILAGLSAPGPLFAPRTNGMCAPVVRCCCKGPVTVGPGEIAAFTMNWAAWLNSIGTGWQVHKVTEASLFDMTEVPPIAADPTIIKVTSGISANDPPPDNADVAALIGLVPPLGTQVFVEVGKDARIGDQYKLSLCMTARDCDGRMARQCDCVVIVVTEC